MTWRIFILLMLACPALAQGPFSTPSRLARFHALSTAEIPGMIAWWKFNDGSGASAVDSGTNGYTLGLSNSPAWTNGGKLSGALVFQATNWASSASAHVGTTNSISVFAWVRANNVTNKVIASQYQSTANARKWLMRIGDVGAAAGLLEVICSANGTSTKTVMAPGNYIPNGSWRHVGFVFTNDTISLWIDGVSVTTSNTTAATVSALYPSALKWNVGAINSDSGGSLGFSGAIDDVRVYAPALSATQIGQIYNGGSGTGGNP